MNKCEYCEILERESQIIASSMDVVIAVKDKVVTPGQITVFPKEHFPIMELVPEPILQQCIILANKVSIAVFESLGSQGTNILVRNGLGAGQDVAHFGIEIIPRKEDDGLKLQWEPRQMPEYELGATYDTLLSAVEEAKCQFQETSAKEQKKAIVSEKGKESYLLKSLKRLP